MSKIKADVKLRRSCMNAEYFHPKIQVIDLDTALECVYQATEEGRKAGADNLIKQAVSNGQKKYQQGMDFMKYKAIKAYKDTCSFSPDGCCMMKKEAGKCDCEELKNFIEKLNS